LRLQHIVDHERIPTVEYMPTCLSDLFCNYTKHANFVSWARIKEVTSLMIRFPNRTILTSLFVSPHVVFILHHFFLSNNFEIIWIGGPYSLDVRFSLGIGHDRKVVVITKFRHKFEFDGDVDLITLRRNSYLVAVTFIQY